MRIETEELVKKFGIVPAVDNVSLSVEDAEFFTLLGPSGCGKTTFLKILMRREKPTSGEVEIGSNLDVGYYDQEHEGLEVENSILDEVWKANPRMLPAEMRSFLGKFLFHGEDVFRKIKSFSGGEQSRVVLAKLILSKPNFLILDEPPNHLDIASREVLENALVEFGGTILVVSHDRYFLNKIVSRLYAFEDRGLKEYLGNYSRYEEKKREHKEKEKKKLEVVKQERKKQTEIKKAKPKIKKRSLHAIEKDISEIEQKIEEIDYLVSTPDVYTDWQKLLELNQEKEGLSKKLEMLYAEWEELAIE